MKGWCAMARRVVYRTMHEDSVAHIYGHHVHIAVNHKCGQLSPYVHFSRHVRHFPSQLWLMLRLPQWWRLRRLQLRLIRGGPVDADKKVNQNRKKWIQILPLAKKWSCFEGCLDVSYVHRSYLYILIPSFYRLGEAWAQGALGTFTGGALYTHDPFFFGAGFLCKKTIHLFCNLDSKSDLSPKNGSFGVKAIAFLGGVTIIAPMLWMSLFDDMSRFVTVDCYPL